MFRNNDLAPKTAAENGFGAASSAVLVDGTPRPCPIQGTLSYWADWIVCDGRHRLVVMKNHGDLVPPSNKNSKTDTTVESQVSKSARPATPPVFLCQHLRTTRVILARRCWPPAKICGANQGGHRLLVKWGFCNSETGRAWR